MNRKLSSEFGALNAGYAQIKKGFRGAYHLAAGLLWKLLELSGGRTTCMSSSLPSQVQRSQNGAFKRHCDHRKIKSARSS